MGLKEIDGTTVFALPGFWRGRAVARFQIVEELQAAGVPACECEHHREIACGYILEAERLEHTNDA